MNDEELLIRVQCFYQYGLRIEDAIRAALDIGEQSLRDLHCIILNEQWGRIDPETINREKATRYIYNILDHAEDVLEYENKELFEWMHWQEGYHFLIIWYSSFQPTDRHSLWADDEP